LRRRQTRADFCLMTLLTASQHKLLIRGRLKAQSVKRRYAQALNRVAVLGRRVADVCRELPAWVQLVGAAHVAVAGDLRDDRGGGDGGGGRVALDDRALLVADVTDGEAIGQADAAGARDADQRVPEGREVRPVQSARVDRTRATRDDADLDRCAHDDRKQLLANLVRVLLGVVEPAQRAQLARRQRLDVEQHAGRDERAREASATRLVGARDPPHAKAAVVREQPATAGALAGGAPAPRAVLR